MEPPKASSTINPITSDYIRIAVVGNVDSGKSTLVAVLTKSLLDDGRGKARLRVFNYPHEAVNGRTSSIAFEIMGYTQTGEQVFADHFVQNKNKYWPEVVRQSSKLISLVDLCGHEKYLKTTMLGMVGMIPDYIMVVVGANLGLSRMTKEHLGIALALNIPFFIVLTKVDMVPEEITKETIQTLQKLMSTSAVNKRSLLMTYDKQCPIDLTKKSDQAEVTSLRMDENKVKECKRIMQLNAHDKSERPEAEHIVDYANITKNELELISKAAEIIRCDRVCPIFPISSTIGYGIPQLSKFLYLLKSRTTESRVLGDPSDPVEFDIHEKFNVNGVGLVASGLLKSGTVKIGQTLMLGPDKNNSFRQVQVKSIHFCRIGVESVYPGQFCCFCLKTLKKKEELIKKDFRKGVVLLDIRLQPVCYPGFEGTITVLHHATTIKVGYECVMHCGIIRQTVRIIQMDKELLRTGDSGKVVFMFCFNHEYLKTHETFLLREGRTKILGIVQKLIVKEEEILAIEKTGKERREQEKQEK